MTPQQALQEGYKHYLYANDDFQSIKHLEDLLLPEGQSEWEKELELCEKEPYHPAGMDAKSLLEHIGDQLQNDHSSESGDDTNDVCDAIKSIDVSIVQPFIDAMNEKLQGLNYYRASGIMLSKE